MSVFSSLFVPETFNVQVAPSPMGDGNLCGAYLRALPALVSGRKGLKSLPTEILAKILLLVPERFEDEPKTWRFSCVLLGFVCMDWMDIVEHNPSFFSNIYVHPHTSLTLVQRTLERSGAVAFTLKIKFPPPSRYTTTSHQMHLYIERRNSINAVFAIVGPEMHRCRRLLVDVDDHRILRRIFALSSIMVGDRMEELSVASYQYMEPSYPAIAQPFAGLMPNLKEMHVLYQAVKWTDYHFMSGLTILTIHNFADDRPTLDFIYEILDATPLLEILRLSLLAVADFEDSEREPSSLPLLSEIDIAADSESGSCLLTLLHMPALRVLRFKVEDDQDNAFQGLLGHCWDIGSQITTLAIQVSLPTITLFLDCFEVFPNIQSFDARVNIGFGVYLLAVVSHWPVGWTSLREVFLDDNLEEEILLTLLVGLSNGVPESVRVISPRELDTEGRPKIPSSSTLDRNWKLQHTTFRL
ncbi:hypothetical protein R3P38DRAFT_3180553 [Favolaschia claudopus]|uniref:F-box domain-containing protein n=1 Tax=Favolaschia claudopus TaxID=2862362 RepID=A0AAW0CPW3_9AGAR